jgi:hypothetical protein
MSKGPPEEGPHTAKVFDTAETQRRLQSVDVETFLLCGAKTEVSGACLGWWYSSSAMRKAVGRSGHSFRKWSSFTMTSGRPPKTGRTITSAMGLASVGLSLGISMTWLRGLGSLQRGHGNG